jgi:hypothetical protein
MSKISKQVVRDKVLHRLQQHYQHYELKPLLLIPSKSLKGEFEGECNRTSCDNKHAVYYNHSTRAYYCSHCAHIINSQNRTEAMDLYGHNLCTYGKPQ